MGKRAIMAAAKRAGVTIAPVARELDASGTTNSAQISSSLVVGDVGEDTRCRHDNGRPGYDLWHCSDCGAVKTDSGWGIAKHRYFNDRAEAEFFRKHGRLPDDGKPQPWGNAAMGAVGAGGGGE